MVVFRKIGLFGTTGLFAVAVLSCCAELLFDAEELVVFGHTVGAACRTGLDLAGVGCNSDVSESSVFRFRPKVVR